MTRPRPTAAERAICLDKQRYLCACKKEARNVILLDTEWVGLCRTCWAKVTAEERAKKAAETRDFKERQQDLLDLFKENE